MYSIDGLEHGIERCKINIEVLKNAVKEEEKTIADYKIMIDKLKRAEKQQEEARANVHVEVVHDD